MENIKKELENFIEQYLNSKIQNGDITPEQNMQLNNIILQLSSILDLIINQNI